MDNITIRRVTENDAEALLEIYAPYVISTAISFETKAPSSEEFRNRIKTISERYPYIAAEENGKIVGYAYAGPFKTRRAYDWSVETTIYIKESEKGKGIGRKLYEALEEALKSMGIINMNACIAFPQGEDEHLTKDSPKFHEVLGFELVGRFHSCAYKFGKWYDMIWMEKAIGQHSEVPDNVAFGSWKLLNE